MSSRSRLVVLSITVPVIAFAIVGGFLGKVMAREGAYQQLRIFDDVIGLIMSNYVEPVNVDKVMRGAMHGLADTLDPDSSFLSADDVKQVVANQPLPAGDVGIELTRQYYLRVIAARDNSPAFKAGLRTGDYVRAIGDMPTREMSVWEGRRLLRGAPGTKIKLTIIRGNAADPRVMELTREALPASEVNGRIAAPGIGYVRVAAINGSTADQVKAQVTALARSGAAKLVLDVRRTSTGAPDQGLSLARLFIDKGTLAIREGRSGSNRETIAAGPKDGGITVPLVLLVDSGTTGAAELFAAALSGNSRADLVGEHTIGRAAVQTLVKLPDGSGLWLSTSRYLMPDGSPLHEKGLAPAVAVDQPEVELGQQAPTADPALDRAIERLANKQAA